MDSVHNKYHILIINQKQLFNIILIINITQLLLYDGKKSVKLKI